MDDRLRDVCSACGFIHYQNPKMVVGCLPTWQDKVLMCKRAIEPQLGLWTLPAGYMENGESTLAGAQRETFEEAGATFSTAHLYRLFDIPYISQTYLFYRAELDSPDYSVGIESSDVRFFTQEDIPWESLAFPVVHDVLLEFFVDRKAGEFPIRTGLPTLRSK